METLRVEMTITTHFNCTKHVGVLVLHTFWLEPSSCILWPASQRVYILTFMSAHMPTIYIVLWKENKDHTLNKPNSYTHHISLQASWIVSHMQVCKGPPICQVAHVKASIYAHHKELWLVNNLVPNNFQVL